MPWGPTITVAKTPSLQRFQRNFYRWIQGGIFSPLALYIQKLKPLKEK